jgi:sodium/bile acid cotransporter 7
VLQWLLEGSGQVDLSAVDLLLKMCYSILLPLAVGHGVQRFVVGWVQRHRGSLMLVSNAALITIPWMKFSESAERLGKIGLLSLAAVVLGGLLVHVVFLGLNYVAGRALRMEPAVRRAVVLVASQKTLPVAMTVLAFLPLPAEVKGLVAIPCVLLHLGQIFLDAFLATHWRGAAT